jgi:hypothetical protein
MEVFEMNLAAKMAKMAGMSKSLRIASFSIFLVIFILSFPGRSEPSEIWETVSADFRSAVGNAEKSPDAENATESVTQNEPVNKPETVEIEYGGKLISVDIMDLILMADGAGGQKIDLEDPEKYAEQLENAPLYGVRKIGMEGLESGNPTADAREITEREHEEERRARQWANVFEDLTLREIDNKALELVKEFSEAQGRRAAYNGSGRFRGHHLVKLHP